MTTAAAQKRASSKRADPTLATITRLLAAGQTTRVDTAGHSQALYAKCPKDGGHSQVRRVSREGGGAIFELNMRCTQCFTDFVATPESLYFH